MSPITQRAIDAAARYQDFLGQLQRQYELAVSSDPTHADIRAAAAAAGREAAKRWLETEGDVLQIDTVGFGREDYVRGADATGRPETTTPYELMEHFRVTLNYMVEILAAQASRDITAMSKAIAAAGIRIDMGTRAGRLAREVQADIVLNGPKASFNFVDRAGRVYKSVKHVRDQYRLHLLMTRNDAFLFAMAEAGVGDVEIRNPDPANKWDGLVVTTETPTTDVQSYYDIRDEVFHPSSDSYLSLVE